MAIVNRTTAEVYALAALLENTLKAVLVYRTVRNTGLDDGVDTALAALKVAVDATIADVTPNAG